MTRLSDYMRQRIVKSAIDLFAERGFEGASVRAIVTKAWGNWANAACSFATANGSCSHRSA
jgi:hypothetical protein